MAFYFFRFVFQLFYLFNKSEEKLRKESFVIIMTNFFFCEYVKFLIFILDTKK